MKKLYCLISILCLLSLAGCAPAQQPAAYPEPPQPAAETPPAQPIDEIIEEPPEEETAPLPLLSLAEVRYWGYQLQGITEPGAVCALADSRYDMLVLEPTRTDWSSGDRLFDTRGMVETLKATADGRSRLVIAYIDIGEAEDWRWYWDWPGEWELGEPRPDTWPSYILAHDPDGWGGNFPVAYWDERWKDIIIYGQNQDSAPYGDYTSALDEVIRDGFDGVYLDWVEGYEDPAVIAEAQRQGRDPAAEMIGFIAEIRDYARSRDPDFIVIQQNAAALSQGRPELFSIIDAIAQESIWYGGEASDDWDDEDGYDIRNEPSLTDYYLEHLESYQDAGIPVFNCEYAVEHVGEAYERSLEKGFIPYCSRTPLSRLTTTPPPSR